MLEAVDREKYNIYLIGIDKSGIWHLDNQFENLIHDKQVNPQISGAARLENASQSVTIDLYHQGNLRELESTQKPMPSLDVIFPVLHGTFGEDGTIQGVFEMAGIPYVGCGVAASSIAMDKALAKKVFEAAGIPQAPCIITQRQEWVSDASGLIDKIESELGFACFVKPANMGSSVGVSKAHNRQELTSAIEDALQYDNKIVVETAMEGCQEIECAVLGNEEVKASAVGEIIPGAEFYDYTTKYIDDKSQTLIPARISEDLCKEVQKLSVKAFKAIDGSGLSRVDFFVNQSTGKVYLNEINTLPGFTPISMYPKLWGASGIPYSELIDQLIDLAMQRHRSISALKRSF